MHNVAVLVPDRVSVFELAVPCEVFGVDRSDLATPWYGFRTVAVDEPPLTTTAGYSLDTPWRLDDLHWADTVIVPAWPAPVSADTGQPWRKTSTTPPPRALPTHVVEAVRGAYARGARVVGLCTGAFVLAAAGLLDGRRATTHWLHARTFAVRYPAVRVDPDYVDEGQVLTSAGTAAGIDLCLHILRRDLGAAVANQVARRMVCAPHRDGGQAQFIEQSVPQTPTEPQITSLLDWVERHLEHELSVADLAHQWAMSTRTFARRFRAATGTTPHRWLVQQRIRRAQHLLEVTHHSVETIATRCGLGSPDSLRRHLRAATGTTPTAYRRMFQTRRDPMDPALARDRLPG